MTYKYDDTLNDNLIRYHQLTSVYYAILEGGNRMVGFDRLNVQPILSSVAEELKELYEEFAVTFPVETNS